MSGDETLARHIASEHDLDCRRWFGGWSLLRDGRQIAMVMDTLYVKVSDDLREHLDMAPDSHPFHYQRSDGRLVVVDAYRSIPADMIDNRTQVATVLSGTPPEPAE